jgi:two-component system, NtrC family, sensor kinase
MHAQRLRHDLRTPVNHLLGYSQLLIEDAQESGTGDGTRHFEQVMLFGKEILKQIELSLPASSPEASSDRLAELQNNLKPWLDKIRETLNPLSLDKSTTQFADVQRLLQATEKLTRFARTGSMDAAGTASPASAKAITDNQQASHLLVVDDDASNRDVLSRMLQRLKYSVSLAANGAEAIEMVGKNSYDLVLLDILMPGMSGYEVLKYLRSFNPDLPVIVVSSLNEVESVVRCISMGAEDYFQKPFEPVLLRARISSALDRQRYRREHVLQQRLASLGEVTAGIAHEIKNPLNFVLNFAVTAADAAEELGREVAAASPAVKTLLNDLTTDLRRIREHGARADEIVNSMLLHCNSSIQMEQVEINQLVARYLNFARNTQLSGGQASEVVVETIYDDAAGQVRCHAADMGRVILNLAKNAFQAALERKKTVAQYVPRVQVGTRKLDEAVEIFVRDNGNGVAGSIRDKIFQPFFTTKAPGEGTGLGLSLSHDIVVQKHKGQLTVNSVEGQFAEFVVRLPRS